MDGRKLQIDRFRSMTPEQRLAQALRLYWCARNLKAAALRGEHPDWSERQIRDAVTSAFAHART